MTGVIRDRIAENLRSIRTRMVDACQRSGRDPASVELIAVVKYARLEWIRALVELGVTDLAENKPQQLIERVPLFSTVLNWHLIGHLQSNKVRKVLPVVRQIHAVDSEKLLGAIHRIGSELGVFPPLLLEVNVSGEETKQGFASDEIRAIWKRLSPELRQHVRGLMTMAPNTGSLEDARRTFSGLRLLRDDLQELVPDAPLPCLSMGMTGDFEIGIEEGATQVRIGSALFEGLVGPD